MYSSGRGIIWSFHRACSPLWLLLLTLAYEPRLAAQGVITTVAGTEWIFPDSGKPAVSARLGRIYNVVADKKGSYYFADYDNHVVLKVGPDGVLTVVAGNGLPGYSGDGGRSLDASLFFPQAVAVDTQGNLYIADAGNARIRRVSAGGTISTVVGTGVPGFSGDGGPGVAAAVFEPNAMVFDGAGNLYIADTRNNRVRRLSPAGIISTIAGTGQEAFSGDGGDALKAALNHPIGLAIDASDVLYISDSYNHRIRRVTKDGIIRTIAGTGAPGYVDSAQPLSAQFSYPKGIVLDSAGAIYFTDPGSNTIRKIAQDGRVSTVAGNGVRGFSGDGGAALKASLGAASGVAIDSSGDVLIGDQENFRIRKLTSAGIITTVAGNGQLRATAEGARAVNSFLYLPESTVFAPDGSMYIADTQNHRIAKVDPDGNLTTFAGTRQYGFSGDGGPAQRATLYFPRAVTMDRAGNLYIADSNNCRIRKVSPAGIITTIAGTGQAGFSGDNGQAINATLSYPTGLALDAAGNLYIADELNMRIRKVSVNGIITTVAGDGQEGYSGDGGPATSAHLKYPERLTLDAAGNILFADVYNHRIRRVSTSGVITTIAGNGQVGYTGDGGPATSAALNTPVSVAIGPSGDVYLSDYGNNVIRRIATDGTISTIAGTGVPGFSGDGRLATQAALHAPLGLSFDLAGNLVIADQINNRIRKVLRTAPSFTVSANSLSFANSAQGAAANQSVTLLSSIPGLAFGVSTSANWMSVTPNSGVMPATLLVSVDPTLAPGTYNGSVVIAAPDASPSSVTISVQYSVIDVGEPALKLESEYVTFDLLQGSSASTQSVAVQNTGRGRLQFQPVASTESGGAWLSVFTTKNQAATGQPGAMTIAADPTGLATGTYKGAIAVRALDGSSSGSINVVMTVTTPQPKLLISQAGMTFQASPGSGLSLPQNLSVLNVGQGEMSWTARATTLGGNSSWLRVSQTAGTLSQPNVDVAQIDVTVDSGGLAPGTYYGQVLVRGSGTGNPSQTVTVVLNVLDSAAKLGPEVRPAALVFTGVAGQSPGSQAVLIGNRSGRPMNYFSSHPVTAGADWVAQAPTAAIIPSSEPARVLVQPDFSKLAPGIYSSAVNFLFEDGSTQSVKILAIVTGQNTGQSDQADRGSSNRQLTPRATSGCQTASLRVQATNVVNPMQGQTNQPIPIEVSVLDNCGQVVDQSRSGISVTLSPFSNGEAGGKLNPSGNGRWNRTVQLTRLASSSGTASNVTSSVTALMALPNGALISDQADITVRLSNGAAVPLVDRGSIVNAASFALNSPVAPGALISIFGSQLLDGDPQVSYGAPLPNQLGGTQVTLGDRQLPLTYAASTQLNAQVPFDLVPNTQYQIYVTRGAALSVPQLVPVAAAVPAIFTIDQNGKGQGAIINALTGTLANTAYPTKAGEVLSIFCTGLGLVSPAVEPGTVAPSSPLSRTVNPVSVTIGGIPATVSFAGLAPGFIGLYQINATVPDTVPTGASIPVVLNTAGQTSLPVTISIR